MLAAAPIEAADCIAEGAATSAALGETCEKDEEEAPVWAAVRLPDPRKVEGCPRRARVPS